VKYFVRREGDGKPALLVRMGTTLPEYLAEDGTWQVDATLVRLFVDHDLEEVDEGQAASLAETLGGSL
jgi:hypothetical protein